MHLNNAILSPVILLLLYIGFVCLNPVPQTSDHDPLKRAYNRTYRGFEKGVNNNTEWSGNFTFIQSADTQFGLIQFFETNFTLSDDWSKDLALFKDSIKEWNALSPAPKFVAICGDLVNEWPAPLGNQTKRRAQLDDFRAAAKQLRSDIPLVLLGGNHDFLNTPTPQSIQQYSSEFGDDYYSFWVGGVMFIVVNVQLYRNSTAATELYIEQDRWLDGQLADAKAANYSHVIVLQHVPWFLESIDEPFDSMWTIAVAERKRVIDRLYAANVRYVFAGHYHRNAFGQYKDLAMVTSSAIGAQSFEGANADSGYRVVKVFRDRVEYPWVNITRSNSASPTTAPSHVSTTASMLWSMVVSGATFGFRKLFS